MADRTSIRLSKQNGTYDMLLTDGIFEMAEDGTAAASALQSRLSLFRDFCLQSPIVDTVANPLAGTDWYGIIFQTSKSKAEKELELKRVILSTPGVNSILTWSWSQEGRVVTITGSVATDWGAVDVSQTIEPL
jgi:hypothetical protein